MATAAEAVPCAVLAVSIALVIVIVLRRCAESIGGLYNVGPVAGTWTVLAQDLTRGLFYRPLLGPDGYGGTRYMPLEFLLHAGLMRLTGQAILSGIVLGAGAAFALCAGTWCLLRRLGSDRLVAGAAALLVPGIASVQFAATTVRSDALALAFIVGGLAAVAPWTAGAGLRETGNRTGRWTAVLPAAACFALAFLTKLTSVYGLAIGVVALLARPENRPRAARLAALSLALMAAGFAATAWASNGRFLENLRACALAGGFEPRGLLILGSRALRFDPVGTFIVLLAAASLLPLRRREMFDLPVLAFTASAAVVVVIFHSPGSDWNHLIDPGVAALLLLARRIATGGIPRALGLSLLAAIAFAAAVRAAADGPVLGSVAPRAGREEALRAIRGLASQGRPLLAEDSGLAVLAGLKPYVLDPFALRVVRARDPYIDRDLREKLEAGFFGAVQLCRDPHGGDEAREWYTREHFGPGFVEALEHRYRIGTRCGEGVIYVPSSDPPPRP